MKPIQLTLKGFKGIKAGMGLDQITLDLEQLPPGIIVLSAPNGTGKTTIMDSLTPYRLMPYRAGNTYRPTGFSYYDHTYGDAAKTFLFEVDGVTYKSKVLIDTDRKKAEAYLYTWRDDPDPATGREGEWDKYPGIDGKLETYDRAVEEVLGSPELFFTSIFRAQNAKALSDYSKGDIKDLFVELLNISHLQAIGEKARRVKQELAGKVEILMVDRKRLQDTVAKEPETCNDIILVQADISCIDGEITSYEQEIITLQEKVNELDVKIGLQKKAREEVDKIRAELNEANIKYRTMSDTAETKGMGLSKKAEAAAKRADTLKGSITTAEARVATLPYLRNLAEEKTTKGEALETTKTDIRDVDASLEVMNRALNDILSADKTIAEKESDLKAKLFSRTNLLENNLKRELQRAQKQADYIKSSGCPVDNPTCKFMKAAVEDRGKIPELERDIELYSKPAQDETDLEAEIAGLKAQRKDPATIRGQIKAVTDTKNNLLLTQKSIEADLQEITKSLESLPLAEQAEAQLPELRKQLQETEAEVAACEAEVATYAAEANKELVAIRETIGQLNMKLLDASDNGPDYEKQKDDILKVQAHFRKEIEEARIRQQGHNQHLGALEETLKQIDGAKGELDTIGSRIGYLNDEVSQWATLEKAFGNDGIIALELDDAGPQISAIANELLQVFGGRFAVRIDTQSAKAAGGMKEVFDITVFDNQTDEQKSIKRLSGGEKTWIEDAVTKAICIYNKTASGRQFKTIYTDEKDGALDFEKKKEFFAMKRRVLDLGGYDREICITQSPELMAMADGVIRLSKENGVEVITNA
jgi:exonuclease SbcC